MDIALTDNNKIAITGNVNCCNGPDSIGPAKSFIYLGELATAIHSISENVNSFITPNPANDFVNIMLNEVVIENENNIKLSFYSISGSFISEIVIDDITQLINIDHLMPGLYIAVLRNENEIFLRSKMIKL